MSTNDYSDIYISDSDSSDSDKFSSMANIISQAALKCAVNNIDTLIDSNILEQKQKSREKQDFEPILF